MGILYRGNTNFEDICEPRTSKNEWGVDVLTRCVSGRKPLLDLYLRGLRQGQNYQGFYLQTWSDDGGACFPQVELVYKGLINGIPNPTGENDTSTTTVSLSGDIESEETAEVIKGEPLESGETRTVHGIKEIVCKSPQTTWRYLLNRKPTGASYSTLNTSEEAVILRSRITAKWKDREMVFSKNVPAALGTALFMAKVSVTMSHAAANIIGTPWWECQDVVVRQFLGDSL